MQLELRKYLYDIQQAATALGVFTRGKSLETFLGDALLRAAVERKFEIIGEAMALLAKRDAQTAARISDYRHIIAFCNILIHGWASQRRVRQSDIPLVAPRS